MKTASNFRARAMLLAVLLIGGAIFAPAAMAMQVFVKTLTPTKTVK